MPAKNAPATPPQFEAQKGQGRPKGVPNKNTAAIRDMVAAALDRVGGVDYLARQAEENPTPFLGLIGKVMPMQITMDATMKFDWTRRALDAKAKAES